MPDLTPEEVLEVVDTCVWKSLNVRSSKAPDCNEYRFAGGKYKEYVYGLDCFSGLEIKGYYFATHIKMRGYIYVYDARSPSYNPNYQLQHAHIAICNKDGRELVTLGGTTQEIIAEQFLPLLASTAVGAAVLPSQWLELAERVFNQVKSVRGSLVSKELLLGILKDILTLLKTNR
jgi:hypothetical protein